MQYHFFFKFLSIIGPTSRLESEVFHGWNYAIRYHQLRLEDSNENHLVTELREQFPGTLSAPLVSSVT